MKISTENSSTMVSSSSSSSSSPTTTTRLPTARILAEKRIQKINQKKAMSSLDNLPQEEMQQLLAKLKDLVPSIPKNRKLSKLEIIQNVIDYILDLEMALECPTKDSSTVTTMALPSSTSPTSNPLGLQQCNHTSHSHHQHYHQVVVSGSSSS